MPCGSEDEATISLPHVFHTLQLMSLSKSSVLSLCVTNVCPWFVQDMAPLQRLVAMRPRPAEKHSGCMFLHTCISILSCQAQSESLVYVFRIHVLVHVHFNCILSL